MPQDKLPIPKFAAKIKAKYPQYKDIEDTVLVQKILAKYPEYNEQVDMSGVIKKKEPTSVGSAASSMALAGGGQVGSSKAPSSGLVITGYETEQDKENKRKLLQSEGVVYDENDPIKSYLTPIQNKIADNLKKPVSESTNQIISRVEQKVITNDCVHRQSCYRTCHCCHLTQILFRRRNIWPMIQPAVR